MHSPATSCETVTVTGNLQQAGRSADWNRLSTVPPSCFLVRIAQQGCNPHPGGGRPVTPKPQNISTSPFEELRKSPDRLSEAPAELREEIFHEHEEGIL